MPIGIQRLNAQRPQPSSQIIFTKPLPGPGEKYAQDFLERIAAICHPIMKANHLSIMTLEEHEPNPEFIGRNFNAGEIIQLVLKAPYTGNWSSFRSVQMVMMHELAHCVQMNHLGSFWKVNNQYKSELRELWGRGYTGDGLWGRGQTLLSGEYHTGTSMENEVLPANLCGGTFRSSRRGKRKRGVERPKETYAERQQRRIKKKFGVNGQTLGNDEDTRIKLENGKKPKGKPRVAGSNRGRELRAAAALARFEQVKEETKQEEESLFGDSETESDDDGVDNGNEAVNADGSTMRDGKGRGMIKVCGDEDQDDVHVKREIEELRSLNEAGSDLRSQNRPGRPNPQISIRHPKEVANQQSTPAIADPSQINLYDIPQYTEEADAPAASKPKINIHRKVPLPADRVGTHLARLSPLDASGNASTSSQPQLNGQHENPRKINKEPRNQTPIIAPSNLPPTKNTPNHHTSPSPLPHLPSLICPICSLTNASSSLLCTACSHVLDTSKVTRYWRCRSDACKGSQYVNAADCGVCGVCGERKGGGEE